MQFFVCLKNRIKVNETILGVSGENIAQSEKFLTTLLRETGFRTKIEKTDKIFVITAKKPRNLKNL